MKQCKRILVLALAAGVLTGALAGPVQAAWNNANSSLDYLVDIMEETESENRGRISMTVGETRDLSDSIRWKGYDQDEDDLSKREVVWQLYSVRWSSSSEAVSVDANGVATANRVGYARITAIGTDNTGQRRSQTVTVGVHSGSYASGGVSSLATAPHSFELHEGKRIDLAALIDPDGSKAVSWTSSNADIAEVFEDGQLVAWSAGRATVTASWTDADGTQHSEEVGLRVITSMLAESTRSVSITLQAGQTVDFARLFYPTYSSSSLRDYGLSSSNSAVATADGMVLTAKAAGSSVVNIYEQESFAQPVVQRFTVTVKG